MSEGGRSYLLNAEDNALAANVNPGDPTITVTDAAVLPQVPFYLVIDPFNLGFNREYLYCTAVAGAVLTVTRNLEGTVGQTHLTNEIVRFAYDKQHLDDIWSAIEAVASSLSVHPFLFDVATAGTPASGYWQRDNVDPTLATTLFFNEVDEFGDGLAILFAELRGGDEIVIGSREDGDDYERYNATGPGVLLAGVYAVPVEDGSFNGTPFIDQLKTKMTTLWARNLKLGGLVDVEVAGVSDLQVLTYDAGTGTWVPRDNAANKGVTSLEYLYDDTLTATPTAGRAAPNNNTPASVTTIFINEIDALGDDVGFVWSNLSVDDLVRLSQKADDQNYEQYKVTSVSTDGTIVTINVTFEEALGSIANNDPIFVYVFNVLPDLDANYLRLDATNSPMTGPIDMGVQQVKNAADATDPQDLVTKAQSELYTDTEVLAGDAERMRWLNLWAPGTYERNETVRDGDWTMVANKQTADPAAPVEVGVAGWTIGDIVLWVTENFTGQVVSSNRYVFAVPGELRAMRGYIPINSTPDTLYRAFVTDWSTGNPITTYGITFTTDLIDQWIEVAVNPTLVGVGTDIEIGLISFASSANLDFTHPWSRIADSNNPVDPGAGNWNRDNNQTSLRISNTDSDATDRTGELASVVIGSHLKIFNNADAASFSEYEIETVGIDQGTWTLFSDVNLVDVGAGGAGIEQNQINFIIPTPEPTGYVTLPNGWLTIPAWFSSVVGGLELDGVASGVPTTTYGIDLGFQEMALSPDWDIVALSGGGGGGGGGGDGVTLPEIDQLYLRLDASNNPTVPDNFLTQATGDLRYPLIADLFSGLHDDLTDVAPDQHHAQSHIHDGLDGSGVVQHSALQGVTADDHHTRYTDAEAVAVGDLTYLRLDSANGPLWGPLEMRSAGGGVLTLHGNGVVQDILTIAQGAGSWAYQVSGGHLEVRATIADPIYKLFADLNLQTNDLVNAGTVHTNSVQAATDNIGMLDSLGNPIMSFQPGHLDGLSASQIKNILDATDPQDAVTKSYVDGRDALYLPLAGGTLTNFLTLHADPTAALHAATKQYVDAGDAAGYFTPLTTLGDIIKRGAAVDERLPIGAPLQVLTVNAGGTDLEYVTPVTGVTDHALLSNIQTDDHHVRYTDSEAVSANAGLYLSLSGGALSGFLTLNADPIDSLHAAPKQYVDGLIAAIPPAFSGAHGDLSGIGPDDHHIRYSDSEAIAANPPSLHHYVQSLAPSVPELGTVWTNPDADPEALSLPLAGGTMAGAINMGGFRIENLADPNSTDDAFPLSYGDGRYATTGHTHPTPSQPGWQNLSLQNGWIYFGPNWAQPQYRVDLDGVVHVMGMIKGGTVTAGTLVATLPAGAQPAYDMIFNIRSSAGSARVNVRGWTGGTPGQIQAESGWSASWTAINFSFSKD